MQTLKLNNGVEMPQLGFGVYLIEPGECERCVLQAISAGYRSIDTAQIYKNEEDVGNAVRKSGVPRSELFITTKVWISNAGEQKAAGSIDESLRKLQTDYIDLLLVHQPFSDYYGTYRAMEKSLKAGKVRAIGVSNFYADRFVDLAINTEIVPAVNQLRTNVFLQQHDEEEEMNKYGTKIIAYAPLDKASNRLFNEPLLQIIAASHGKTIPQIALRYIIQRGMIAIPKTTHVERMEENINVFDFVLTDAEMNALNMLDTPLDYSLSHRNPAKVRRLNMQE